MSIVLIAQGVGTANHLMRRNAINVLPELLIA